MKGVILAGGRGTRLRPFTYSIPKPAVSFMNRPFLEYEIDLLKRHGIDEILLCTNYLEDVIRAYFGDGSSLGVHIEYVTESVPLGTAGALKNAERLLDGSSFVVFNGDVLTDFDLGSIIKRHREIGAQVTLTLAEVDDPSSYGLILLEEGHWVRKFLEKPGADEIEARTINAGIYIIEPDILSHIPPGREVSIERETFPLLLRSGIRIGGHVASGYWLDIGTISKYMQGHFDILAGKVGVDLPCPERVRGIWVGEGCAIDDAAVIEPPVLIGAGSVIETDSRIGPFAVIGERCMVGRGSIVEMSILHDGVKVGERSRLRDGVVATGAEIEEDSVFERMALGARSFLSKGSREIKNITWR